MDRRNPDCRDATNPCHPWSLGSGGPCRNDGGTLNSTALPPRRSRLACETLAAADWTAMALAAGSAQAVTYTVTDLGSLSTSIIWSQATGINASGQVVGFSDLADGTSHAFLYSGGAMQDLGTLGGPPSNGSSAWGINNSGQVAGSSSLTAVVYVHAFLYSGGAMHDLGTLCNDLGQCGPNSYALGINASGQVAGQADIPGETASHAALYSGGSWSDLGTLGGNSQAQGINNSGQVVGWFYNNNINEIQHAFLYSGGIMLGLDTLGGSQSFAYGINDSGQVVGWSTFPPYNYTSHAFLYSGGVMTDLNALLASNATGWVLSQANAINDAGQIVGMMDLNGAAWHAFLLTPTYSVIPLLSYRRAR